MFKVNLLRTVCFSTTLALILHPATLKLFRNNFQNSKYVKYSNVIYQLGSILRSVIITLLVAVAINVLLARIFRLTWLIRINLRIRDVAHRLGLVQVQVQSNSLQSDNNERSKRQRPEADDWKLVGASDDEFKKMIEHPKITFHHYFRDLWKHRARNPKSNLVNVAHEAAKKWNRLTREQRSDYKAQLVKRPKII